VKLRIERTDGRLDEFEVPEFEGMTVLDAIMYVREHHDPSIAVRFACRCANACKECVTVIDGRRDYACTVPATGEVQVGPLPNKRLIHDLAVDL
jgi:succinate dehydrogenase/fumarate reductase-like Fe-S protein